MISILNKVYSEEHKEHRVMDIYIPEVNAKGIGILFIHGGGFHAGTRNQWTDVAKYFCNLGYTCATASYRLSQTAVFPGAVEDVYIAMDFFKRNAEKYKIFTSTFAAVGSSAGGYLVSMLATKSKDRDERLKLNMDMSKLVDIKPDAMILYCPVTNLCFTNEFWEGYEHGPNFIREFMGVPESEFPELYKIASPYYSIKGNEPPVLMLHGDIDKDVPIEHSALVCNKINNLGGKAELISLEGVKHGFGYGIRTDAQKASIENMEEFLRKQVNIVTN